LLGHPLLGPFLAANRTVAVSPERGHSNRATAGGTRFGPGRGRRERPRFAPGRPATS
jgi:hypothetical protein